MQHCNIDCNYLHICLWPISHLPGFYFTIRGRGEVLLNYYSHKQTQSKLPVVRFIHFHLSYLITPFWIQKRAALTLNIFISFLEMDQTSVSVRHVNHRLDSPRWIFYTMWKIPHITDFNIWKTFCLLFVTKKPEAKQIEKIFFALKKAQLGAEVLTWIWILSPASITLIRNWQVL
jgi:hypothetical protein